jgi:hypothetical protein
MHAEVFSSPKIIVTALIVLAILAASPNTTIASAQKDEQILIDVLPPTRVALLGESYIVNIVVYSGVPVNFSLSFNIFEGNGVKIQPLNDTSNVVLKQDDTKIFKFNITIERTAVENIIINFILRSNITEKIVKSHTIKILLARHVLFNLTKKLADQEINITICCKGSGCFSNSGKTDKNGLFLVNQEIPALRDNICNLTVVLKTRYGSFLVNETIGSELEKLLNTTIYPGFLINTTLNTITLEGNSLESKNLFAEIKTDSISKNLSLSEARSIFLGASERGKVKRVNISIEIIDKNIYLLNSSYIEIKKEGVNLNVYLNDKLIPLANKNNMIINISVPIVNTTFSLFYLDKKGYAKLTSGVMRLVEVEVPLAYNSSTGFFSERVSILPNASVITVREYNNTPARINITIEFAGVRAVCDDVSLTNGTSFRCDNIESFLLLKGGEAIIVVNTTSSPLRGRVEFDDLTRRVLFLGTIRVPGVPKNASGTLMLGSFSVPFKCVSEQTASGYVCEGEVFLWPLAFLPIQSERSVTGELRVDGEIYRLEIGLGRLYAGVWGFALAAIAVIAVVVAVLARRPASPTPSEKVEVYDEHYDLG